VSLPPLVEPADELTIDEVRRYSRHLIIPDVGMSGQKRLKNAKVLVIGAGGLGSAVIPYLASAGFGTIGIADTDVVELSNLHRQVVHGVADLGRSKLDSIADAVAAIDPSTTVVRHRERLDSGNILEVLSGYDLLLDGSDNFPTRYLADDAAALTRKPLVWGAILRYSGQAGVSWEEHGPTYRDLFPAPPARGTVPSCAEGGVLPSVCAVIGAIMSSEAVKLVTGIGEPLLGVVTTYDALTGRFREIPFSRADDAEPVTGLIAYEAFCGRDEPAATRRGTDSEGRDGDEAAAQTSGCHAAGGDTVSAAELADLLASGRPLQLVDIREPFERRISAIEPSLHLPLGSLPRRLGDLRDDLPIVLYCHTGVRSAHALALLREVGFPDVRHLAGGIDAYSSTVAPALARY
jgi:adenylyltransferase/sulfurtransferase